MAKPRVLASIETDDGQRCVDLFVRQDQSFGFEEYRRDPEDPRGWFAVGGYRDLSFASEHQARDAATACVPWFGNACLKENK